MAAKGVQWARQGRQLEQSMDGGIHGAERQLARIRQQAGIWEEVQGDRLSA